MIDYTMWRRGMMRIDGATNFISKYMRKLIFHIARANVVKETRENMVSKIDEFLLQILECECASNSSTILGTVLKCTENSARMKIL